MKQMSSKIYFNHLTGHMAGAMRSTPKGEAFVVN